MDNQELGMAVQGRDKERSSRGQPRGTGLAGLRDGLETALLLSAPLHPLAVEKWLKSWVQS